MHPLFTSHRSFLAVLLFWLGISVFVAMLLVLVMQNLEVANLYGQSFALVVPWYLLLLFVCFSNFYICQWLPLETTSIFLVLGAHWVAASISIGLWMLSGYFWSGELIHFNMQNGRELFTHTFHANWLLGAILYFLWVFIHYIYFSAITRERENAQILQQQLLINDIEFKSVKAALHPHFMYNSLNMLANLSLVAPGKIHSICVQMSEFLRYSVNYSKKERVTVSDEIHHIKNYLAIEQERFGDHLSVSFQIDATLNNETVIPLLLFPLIENSIKHGIDSSTEPGDIRVEIQRQKEAMNVTIDNSFDKTGNKAASTGLGLSLLKKRLHTLYGPTAKLSTTVLDNRFVVTIRLPLDIPPKNGETHLVTN